jgi:hypothetical protein
MELGYHCASSTLSQSRLLFTDEKIKAAGKSHVESCGADSVF